MNKLSIKKDSMSPSELEELKWCLNLIAKNRAITIDNGLFQVKLAMTKEEMKTLMEYPSFRNTLIRSNQFIS